MPTIIDHNRLFFTTMNLIIISSNYQIHQSLLNNKVHSKCAVHQSDYLLDGFNFKNHCMLYLNTCKFIYKIKIKTRKIAVQSISPH